MPLPRPEHLPDDTKTDSHLVEEWQAGHNREEIFRSLFNRYYPMVARFFKSRGFSGEEQQDLAQETFLGAYRGLTSFRFESRFETWLLCIARNVWLNAMRGHSRAKRAGKEVPLEGSPQEAGQQSRGIADPQSRSAQRADLLLEDELLEDERRRLVRDAIARLTPQQQRIVMLRLSLELKYSEIAAILQIPTGTVKSQLSRAYSQLRRVLGDR